MRVQRIKISVLALAIAIFFMPIQGAYAITLNEALIATYKNNPRLKAERKALAATDEEVAQAVSGWRPNITADYSRGRQRNQYGDAADWQYGDEELQQLSVRQPLFNGGETIFDTSRAKNTVKAARANLYNAEQQVLVEAIVAFMNVVRDQAVFDLSRNNEMVLRKQLQAAKDRFTFGEVTRTDVAQSEARVASAVTDVAQSQGALVASRAEFERITGLAADNLLPPENFPELPKTLEEAIGIGEKLSPLLNAARYNQAAAEDAENTALSGLLPDISLVGTMRREEGAGVDGLNDFDTDSVTVNASIPLYQSGAEYSRIRRSKAQASERRFLVLAQQDLVRQNITQAWQNVLTNHAAIQSTEEAIRAAEVALEGVKQEQLYGSRTVLDVLDAEQELFAARVALVRVQRNRAVAVYDLLATMGLLNVEHLELGIDRFNDKANYNDVKYQFFGW